MFSEEGTEPHKALPLDMFLGAGCEEKTAVGRKTGRGMRREERDEGQQGDQWVLGCSLWVLCQKRTTIKIVLNSSNT